MTDPDISIFNAETNPFLDKQLMTYLYLLQQ